MRRQISPGRLVATVLVVSIGAGLAALLGGGASDAADVPRAGTAQGSAPITRIELRVQTGNKTDAGTDGDVFLGVAGREFFVDSRADDFERASNRTYVFGEGATVVRPTENDPRSPWPLIFDDLRLAPRYLRFEPGSDWNVGRIDLTVVYAGGSLHVDALEGNANLWLGEKRGKFLYLR